MPPSDLGVDDIVDSFAPQLRAAIVTSIPSLPSARHDRRLLIALLAATLAVVMMLLASQIWLSRREALREAATKSHNYVAIMEARLDATLRRTDSVLQDLVSRVPDAAFDRRAVPHYDPEATAALDGDLVNFGELSGLRVFGADGELLYTSASAFAPRANIVDREYFRALRDDPRAGLVFSPVISITSTGRQSLVAARAKRDQGGRFLGVALAVIELEYFRNLFKSLDVGPNGVLVIRRSDDYSGVVRWPVLEREINRPLPLGNPVRTAMEAGATSGTVEYPASSDGVIRTYSWRSVERYPFFVLAALARDDVLEGWRTRSLAVGAAGGIMLLLLIWLLARLWRSEARQARAVTALTTSEERLRLALDASKQGLYDLDVQTGVAQVNEEYARMLGYDPATFQETNTAWIERLHPHDRERVAGVYADYIAGRIADYRVEFRQRMRDSGYKWLLSVGKVVERDEQGRPLRMLGTHRDISERKDAERAMMTLNAELESRVEQRTAELVSAKNEADRANRAKSEFLSAMSHELRTPMNAILGFGQLLELSGPTLSADKRQSYVREIMRAGGHLLELIDDLLDLARIEAGKQRVFIEPVELSTVIGECTTLVETAAREHGVQLGDLTTACRGCHVAADAKGLRQVLLNLLSNAIKYNRKGGTVRLGCALEGDAVRISVSDTGYGLSAEQRDRLFTAFERLNADRSAVRGTGIGLALSRRLVELMGGEIGVDSEVGVGSTFWIRLPRAVAATPNVERAAPREEAVAVAAAARDTHTVLYIEDNRENAELMQAVLSRRADLRLICAPLPELGLDLAAAERPDVILLDIKLPGMNGFEVLERLRAADDTRSIPVIAVTANAMPQDIERGLAAGFLDYLTKPVDVARLLATIDAALAIKVSATRVE